MIKRLRFVSVAVPDLEEALGFYRDALGLSLDPEVKDPHHALHVAQLEVGESALSLLQPTDERSPVGRFLQQRGAALYHVSFEVDDIELAMRTLLARGAELLDREPRDVKDGRIAFVRPRGLQGLLVELWEAAAPERTGPAGESGARADEYRSGSAQEAILPPERQ